MQKPIYLDYSSSTPIDNIVYNEMIKYMNYDSGYYGNPSSKSHIYGWNSKKIVERNRNIIAKLICVNNNEIIFTSGATESNNLAIKGIVYSKYFKNKNHIITNIIEHKSIINICKYLESKGFIITWLKPKANGLISIDDIKKSITNKTSIITIMHVNNEIGVIQDIENIGNLCKKMNIIFHVDATQSLGKIFIDLSKINVDLMSFSGHKIYGPKGIGVLYIKSNIQPYIESQIHGGDQEYGIRSGTLPVHQIVGFGTACKLFLNSDYLINNLNYINLRNSLWNGLNNCINGLILNSDLSISIPNILNISIDNVDGKLLAVLLKNISVSSGSACNSNNEMSYVLKSIGVSKNHSLSSIRFSIGRYTTIDDINYTIIYIRDIVKYLRKINYNY